MYTNTVYFLFHDVFLFLFRLQFVSSNIEISDETYFDKLKDKVFFRVWGKWSYVQFINYMKRDYFWGDKWFSQNRRHKRWWCYRVWCIAPDKTKTSPAVTAKHTHACSCILTQKQNLSSENIDSEHFIAHSLLYNAGLALPLKIEYFHCVVLTLLLK